ncbi:MAG: hypothetical protein ACXV4A_09405 [Actinomycetes bacterium]
MAVDVDQLTGHGVAGGVDRLEDGLDPAANRGHGEEREHGVEEHARTGTERLHSRGLHDHPDRHREQRRGPQPAEHVLAGRAEHDQGQAAESHERSRNRGPPLRLVGEPDGEHG